MTTAQPLPMGSPLKAFVTANPTDPALPRPWAGLPAEMKQPLAQQFGRLLLRLRVPQSASLLEKSHVEYSPVK
jgi:hypothetical protein